VAISPSVKTYGRARREEFLSEEFEHPSAAAGAEERLLLGEKRQALVDSIRRLAAADRQIIVLHLEGLSYAEIEEVTGLSDTAIATRLSRTAPS